MKKKTIIICMTVLSVLGIIFFLIYHYKISNSGNNIINRSKQGILEYILNIESYEATLEVTIQSNKNENKYKVKQMYNKHDNFYKQEFIEPENISGISYTYDGINLNIENLKTNLTKMYKDYPYVCENNLGLNDFIKDYEEADEKRVTEEGDMVILILKVKNGNKYIYNKKLTIDRQKGAPIKLEVQDVTQKVLVYILYNEIKINHL